MTTPDDERAAGGDPEHPRRVRSFVRRAGRMTRAQERALAAHRERFVLDVTTLVATPDWDALFDAGGALTLEIGFGMGDSLAAMAAAEPDRRFVGVEVHEPGIGALLGQIEALGLTNLMILAGDVAAGLETCFAEASLDRVQIYFPDPWPKKRHHKRRLIQPGFVARLASRVAAGGTLHLATDWEPYAEHMLEVLEAAPDWDNVVGPGQWLPEPPPRPRTKFERRGLARGHRVRDLLYRRR